MPAPKEIEQLWHCDGHELLLRINRAELEILSIFCPHEEKDGPCKNRKGECIVSTHITRYGMDCNGGVSPAMEKLSICWTLIGDVDDIDFNCNNVSDDDTEYIDDNFIQMEEPVTVRRRNKINKDIIVFKVTDSKLELNKALQTSFNVQWIKHKLMWPKSISVVNELIVNLIT
jgi:hypothetical protein